MGNDANIVIGVTGDISGGVRVKRNLDDIANSGDATKRSMDLLSKAVVAIGGTAVIRSLINVSDAFTEIENRLRVATDSQAEFTRAMEGVKQIANETFSSISSTADAYARFEIASKDLGRSQEDILRFTRLVADSFRISGASASEASNAMIQLGQALASGVLRGDEFNSIAENNSVLLGTLAESLGKTRGELRQMAADGQITAQVLIDNLLPAFEDIEKKAQDISPTFGRAFEVLKNNLTVAIGESQTFDGVMALLSGTVLLVANNIDVLADAITILGGAIAALAISSFISALVPLAGILAANTTAFIALAGGVTTLTGAVDLLNATFLVGPGALIAVLGAVAGAAYVFRDELGATLIFIMYQAAEATDAATSALKRFAIESAGSLKALSLAAQNKTGFLSDDEYLKQLTQLQDDQTAAIGETNSALEASKKLRAEIYEEDQRVNAGIGKDPSYAFDASGASAAMAAKKPGASPMASAAESTKDLTKNVKEAGDESNLLLDYLKKISAETDRFSNNAADAFADFVTGASSAQDALRSIGRELISLASRSIFSGSSSGGGLGGALSGVLGSLFSGGLSSAGNAIGQSFGSLFSSSPVGPYLPGFANGGSMTIAGNGGVDKNLLSINNKPVAKVGSGEDLTITPKGANRGGGAVVNQTFNISTGVQQTVRAEIMRMLPQIQTVTTQGVEDAAARTA